MLKLLLVVCAVFVAEINTGLVKSSRIFNGDTPPTNPEHACVILVRAFENAPTASLGAGSILSSRHILTVASLVITGSVYEIGHGWLQTTGLLRRVTQTAIILPGFNSVTFANDLAIIILPVGDQINLSNPRIASISITADTNVPTSGSWTIIGWGFTSISSTGMSAHPYEATLDFLDTETCRSSFTIGTIINEVNQFCASSSTMAACSGDNGAGLYEEVPADNTVDPPVNAHLALVGIASNIAQGCAANVPTTFTALGLFRQWILDIIS